MSSSSSKVGARVAPWRRTGRALENPFSFKNDASAQWECGGRPLLALSGGGRAAALKGNHQRYS
jgi:hypothetical protein